MREDDDEPAELEPVSRDLDTPPEETPNQLAYRMSFAWVNRCIRDTARLHLENDRIKLLWRRMYGNLPHLRTMLERLQRLNALEGVEPSPAIPEALVEERLLANLICDLEQMDIFPSAPVRDVLRLNALPPIDPTPVRARVTMWESGAWQVHAASSGEPAGTAHDFYLSAELPTPARVTIPAYAIMTEADL